MMGDRCISETVPMFQSMRPTRSVSLFRPRETVLYFPHTIPPATYTLVIFINDCARSTIYFLKKIYNPNISFL
jgi:hypothetical protein